MKKRANIIMTMTASALILLASQGILASETMAPAHAPASSDPEKADTLVYSATKSLIESFGELSKTASKLSETALKLLEAQESLDEKRAKRNEEQATPEPQKKTVNNSSNSSKKSSTRKKSQDPAVKESEDNALKEIAEEVSSISNEIAIIPASASSATSESVSNNVYISDDTDKGNETVTQTTVTDDSIWFLPEENQDGGRYLWIPDNDVSAVKAILNGEAPTSMNGNNNPDLDEMTYWRGDSIPMALHTKRLGRYDRKLYNWLIYPKGLWHIGLTANYGELSTDDSEFLSLITDVDLKGKIYSIKPSVSYFLRNNLCVGMRLAFTKGEMGINSFKVDIDEDMSFDLHDIKYTSDSYAAAVFIQQYFGLSRRGRFAVFNEAELSYGSGSTHFIRPFDGNIRDTRTKTQSLSINYSPGVSIMMMKNAAFNLSFGVFGFHLKDEKQWENGEEAGSRFTSGINFRFNIFNINFGVSIII